LCFTATVIVIIVHNAVAGTSNWLVTTQEDLPLEQPRAMSLDYASGLHAPCVSGV